jgi:hypothetical protein
LIRVKDEATLAKYYWLDSGGENRNRKHWRESPEGKLVLDCMLIEKLGGGVLKASSYMAVILGEGNNEVIGWDEVVLDSEGRELDSYKEPCPFRFFGFRMPFGEQTDPTEAVDFELRVQDAYDGEYLRRLRKIFELTESAKIYNSLKREDEEKQLKKDELERCYALIDEMAEWRLENPEEVTEVFLWKEHEFRSRSLQLREELFGHLKHFQHLEDVWYERLNRGLIPPEEGAVTYYSRNKLVDLDVVKFGEVYVRIENVNGRHNLSSLVAKPIAFNLFAEQHDERMYFYENSERLEFLQVGSKDSRFSPIGYLEKNRQKKRNGWRW